MEDIIAVNKRCEINFEEAQWPGVSAEAIDLVKLMLRDNPADRISAEDALKHKWFSKVFTEHNTDPAIEVDRMRNAAKLY